MRWYATVLLALATACGAPQPPTGEKGAVMNALPVSENAPVIRTDFSNEAAWRAIRSEIARPHDVFQANVDFIDDRRFEGKSGGQIMEEAPPGYDHLFVILVDARAIADPEHSVLVVDLYEGSGRSFRALPSQIGGIENNLSIANMDFAEFADHVAADGVFRGFEP